MIAIIDYDAGNVKSVEKAVEHLGFRACLTRDSEVITGADHVILPGVGCFGDSMHNLEKYGLVSVIHKTVDSGVPFLGICVGLQLLFEDSEESPGVDGLGILKGSVKRIPGENLKIPHIGWNSLKFTHPSALFKDIDDGSFVYFVHSYYLEAQDEQIVTATTEYGTLIHAAVESGNVYATQFHPEKSSEVGLKILKNFLEI